MKVCYKDLANYVLKVLFLSRSKPMYVQESASPVPCGITFTKLKRRYLSGHNGWYPCSELGHSTHCNVCITNRQS